MEDKKSNDSYFINVFGWWCLKPLSTIFQLCCAVSFIDGGNSDPDITIDLSQITDKLYDIMLYTSLWSKFKLTTLVVIGTGCIGSSKSNYHTVMAVTAPYFIKMLTILLYIFKEYLKSLNRLYDITWFGLVYAL